MNDENVHARLVESNCTNDGLDQLMQAMEKIGDACIAVATVRSDRPEGGSPPDAAPDASFDSGPVDSGLDAGPDSDRSEGGSPPDAAPDLSFDLGPVDSGLDAGPDVAVDTAADADCVVPLAGLAGYCPASYDDVLANNVTCQTYEAIDVGECASDHLLMFRRSFGTHTAECFYDPTSRALVAAAFGNDTPVCGDSHVETTSATPFCQPVCGDSCAPTDDARFVHLERYRDCCRTWMYPLPGCPTDGGAGP